MGNGCIVVTSDRELRTAVEASGAVAIYAGEFETKLRNLGEYGLNKDEGFNELRVYRRRGNPRRLSKRAKEKREAKEALGGF